MKQQVEDGILWRRWEPESPAPQSPAHRGPALRGTVLLIHGLGESGLSFEVLAARLAAGGWRALVPDLPGYGKTAWRQEPQTLPQAAAELARWLEKYVRETPQLGPVVVLGHSMGGVVGTMLAEELPQPVAALVNVEGNISFDDCGFSSRIARYLPEEFPEAPFLRLLQAVYRESQDDLQEALRTYFVSMSLCDPRQLYRHAVELVELSRAEQLAERLARLPMPQIYLLGDPRGTGAHSRSLLEAAGIPWRAIADAGHWPFLDQPEAFASELWGFLEALDSDSGD
ncbi:MAG: alpha/beta fold hydrolase [Acidobacteriota bacterium]|nr:alpha/beta fold hydrolase [Acidobacteriota bacterium]